MENRRAARRSAQHPVEPPVWAKFEEWRDSRTVDDDYVDAARERMMEAEEILYQRWERDSGTSEIRGDNVGLLLSVPVQPARCDELLWILGLAEKVAALGGHLEVHAVFGGEDMTLMREPGPEGHPPIV